MTRPRDRASAAGLLPRMEARPLKSGGFSYRYHQLGNPKPVNLGRDRAAALQKVLDLNGDNSDRGTVIELWRLYRESPGWALLAEATRTDFTQSSGPLLAVFGAMQAAAVKPKHCNRYLRVERAAAPVRANREMALLSNLLNLAVERGDVDANPCKQVRRNKEQPRSEAPEVVDLAKFLTWAAARGGQPAVLSGMAEFASLAGSRRIEFRELTWPQVGADVVRLQRAKQRGKIVVEKVRISPALADLFARMRLVVPDARVGAVFPNSTGGAHAERGFKSAWSRLMAAAIKAGVVTTRFTFHDLRAYYTTQHKAQHGALPDLHSNPATTARVYDRSTEVERKSL